MSGGAGVYIWHDPSTDLMVPVNGAGSATIQAMKNILTSGNHGHGGTGGASDSGMDSQGPTFTPKYIKLIIATKN